MNIIYRTEHSDVYITHLITAALGVDEDEEGFGDRG